jgi:proteasome lid subunit RPN8/RPN11
MSLLDQITPHAQEEYPNEACGLVCLSFEGTAFAVRARNLSPSPRTHAVLDPQVWLDCENFNVVGTYHSHPDGSAEPGDTDRIECARLGLSTYIVGWPSRDFQVLHPTQQPYEGRRYVYGTSDCCTLAHEWLHREMGQRFLIPPSQDGWWLQGGKLFEEGWAACGFTRVEGNPRRGDVILFQLVSPTPDHMGVYVGDDLFLHQPRNSTSTTTPYRGYWLNHTWGVFRHD